MKEPNEMTRQFSKIYKSYTDPIEIKKRLAIRRREKIKEDKQSLYCLHE